MVEVNTKRSYFNKNEILLMTNVNDGINNVANALRETGPIQCRHVSCYSTKDIAASPKLRGL
jgi:hypothetical protein